MSGWCLCQRPPSSAWCWHFFGISNLCNFSYFEYFSSLLLQRDLAPTSSSSSSALLVRSQCCKSLGMLSPSRKSWVAIHLLVWCQITSTECLVFKATLLYSPNQKPNQSNTLNTKWKGLNIYLHTDTRQQFLSIKRTLQINMKDHTFIILVNPKHIPFSSPLYHTWPQDLKEKTSQMLLTVSDSQFGALLTPIPSPKTALPHQRDQLSDQL